MPANPMPRSPHKKVNGWARGYNPTFGPSHGANTGGHGGDTPLGKKKKMARFKTQPPGFPQGVHLKDPKEGQICLCGRCYSINFKEIY